MRWEGLRALNQPPLRDSCQLHSATDLSGLPACYIEVGQLDIFRDEDLAYAERLSRAGVPVELHLRPGVPHEFETFAFASDVARRSVADRLRALQAI